MSFKHISIFSSGGHFVQRRGMVCETLVGEIISIISVILFEFGPMVLEMLFKDISIFSSESHNVQQSRTICAILVQGIIRYTNL